MKIWSHTSMHLVVKIYIIALVLHWYCIAILEHWYWIGIILLEKASIVYPWWLENYLYAIGWIVYIQLQWNNNIKYYIINQYLSISKKLIIFSHCFVCLRMAQWHICAWTNAVYCRQKITPWNWFFLLNISSPFNENVLNTVCCPNFEEY